MSGVGNQLAVGDKRLSLLLDGTFDAPAEAMTNVSPAAFRDLMARAGLLDGAYRAPVNVFAVRFADGALVLIDAGAGSSLGPASGHLSAAMEANGLAADAVTAVLVTHMHPDHVGGLLDGVGQARFANADLFVAEPEQAFWRAPNVLANAPDEARPFVLLARSVLDAYSGRVRSFEGARTLLPGITSVPLPGHTPGHTGYRIEDGDDALLVWGDIVHVAPLQFPCPEIGYAYDVDGALAERTRRKILRRACGEGWLVAGMHLPRPAVGRVVRNEAEYAWVAL